jgi:diguanylate cyclase (GGDEF)-like protein
VGQNANLLQNCRHFEDALAALVEAKRPFSLIMFDIDHFKGINEVFGHEAGDQLLQSLMTRVQPLIRGTDIFRRLRGDEFVILMPDTVLHMAAKVAERLRSGMQGDSFRLGTENRLVSVTISIGLVESSGDASDLLPRAEKALRHSKQAGRNRVFIDAATTTPQSKTAAVATTADFSAAPRKPEHAVKRKIAAIMAADVAFYSQRVATDEEGTLRLLSSYRSVFDDFVHRYDGRVFNTAGDSIMSEFSSAVESVRAAMDIQEALRNHNVAYPLNRQLQFRIGITIADVVEHHGELLGDGVNLASRLESLAEPGGICISRSVHEAVINKLSVSFSDLGQKTLKNIPTPVHAFLVHWPAEAAASSK